ncbi:zinc metalloprotease HtpX [Geomobilimonas luticola]|uniref:Protease HtpX homolog n=1 Tax=Geomobilimonas luticola TaxID=1114878 RepID=A0ABS5S9T7_9BACT|nr:zinc metalloprotease HtpX [Geomobilimonas luticola]MBT0652133.1 zinc metalloprotease HtpX [Geomobilimonas luticola]
MNTLKTTFLMAMLTMLLVLAGGAIGGRGGMTFALIMAGVMNFVSYWFSDKIVLAMYGAKEVTESEQPEFYGLVRQLATRAAIPMPRVYIIPSETPNAFATGRNPEHAAVAATAGIMRILTREELMGVMAHELSHVKNRDILISSVAATIAGAITYLAQMAQWAAIFGGSRDRDEEGGGFGLIVMAIVAPIAAMLIQMAISRSREYGADRGGAQVAGNPLYLANALRKLEMANRQIPMGGASPATAHMFIVNPLTGGGLMSLFSTHPPMEERVRRLEEMAYGPRG